MDKEKNENSYHKINLNWYPGHMAKTKKQIIEDLKLIDVVIEILDARIPLASTNPDIEKWVENKNRIIILNKADLANPDITQKWIKYYEDKGINAISVEANNQKGIIKIIESIKKEYKTIEEKYIQKGRIGKAIRVMILGIPNVGKSTIINSLAKKNTAKVGNKPGVTKQKQWIKIDNNIELMDTPGMLWPKLEDNNLAMHLAYVGTIGSNAIDNEEIAYYLLNYLKNNYPEELMKRYKLESLEKQTIEIMEEIARKRGAILSGNNINIQKISDIILNEFQEGKIGRITIEFP